MATNEILQFGASATGGDILDQAAYTADAERTGGHQVGIARNELENKVLLQVSTISAALAQYVADSQTNNIADSVAVATLADYIEQAVRNTAIMYAVAGGTSDAITATFFPATDQLTDGRLMIVRCNTANTTTTPTFNPDGLGAKPIVKGSNNPLEIGDISGLGFHLILSYDSALDKFVLNNPARGVSSTTSPRQIFSVVDSKPNGVDGGTFTAGSWQTRTLNTIITNTISGASLSNNRITLPAGTYIVTAHAPGLDVNQHQAVLFGVSGDTGNLIVGTSENTTDNSLSTSNPVCTKSVIVQHLTLSTTTVLELRHKCSVTRTGYGLGSAASTGAGEIYSTVFIERVLLPTVYPWLLPSGTPTNVAVAENDPLTDAIWKLQGQTLAARNIAFINTGAGSTYTMTEEESAAASWVFVGGTSDCTVTPIYNTLTQGVKSITTEYTSQNITISGNVFEAGAYGSFDAYIVHNGTFGVFSLTDGEANSRVFEKNATTYNLADLINGTYNYFSNASAVTLTVQPNATAAIPANAEYEIEARGAGGLTIVAGSGVTIIPPKGGSLVLAQGDFVKIKRTNLDEFKLIGTTV